MFEQKMVAMDNTCGDGNSKTFSIIFPARLNSSSVLIIVYSKLALRTLKLALRILEWALRTL